MLFGKKKIGDLIIKYFNEKKISYEKNSASISFTVSYNDFSIYPYATYYTGIIFDCYLENASKSIISGGRCNVFKSFGLDYSDIGFGLDIDVLTQYALDTNLINVNQERYLSYSDKDSYIYSLKMNDSFRDKGIIVNDLRLKSLEETLKYAKDFGYSKVISYSNNSFKLLEV